MQHIKKVAFYSLLFICLMSLAARSQASWTEEIQGDWTASTFDDEDAWLSGYSLESLARKAAKFRVKEEARARAKEQGFKLVDLTINNVEVESRVRASGKPVYRARATGTAIYAQDALATVGDESVDNLLKHVIPDTLEAARVLLQVYAENAEKAKLMGVLRAEIRMDRTLDHAAAVGRIEDLRGKLQELQARPSQQLDNVVSQIQSELQNLQTTSNSLRQYNASISSKITKIENSKNSIKNFGDDVSALNTLIAEAKENHLAIIYTDRIQANAAQDLYDEVEDRDFLDYKEIEYMERQSSLVSQLTSSLQRRLNDLKSPQEQSAGLFEEIDQQRQNAVKKQETKRIAQEVQERLAKKEQEERLAKQEAERRAKEEEEPPRHPYSFPSSPIKLGLIDSADF